MESNPCKKIKLDQDRNIDFPNEIWSKILKYLPSEDVYQSLSLVSKRFQSLALNSGVLRVIKFENLWISKEKMNFLKNSITPKKFIFCGRSVGIADPNFEVISKARNLKSLVVEHSHLAPVAIGALKHSNSKLEHIELQEFDFSGMSEIMIGISKIKTLKTFRMIDPNMTPDFHKIINAFAENENQLENIEFDYIIDYDEKEKSNKLTKAMNNLLEKKSDTLRCLKFVNLLDLRESIDPTVPLTNLKLCQKLEEFCGALQQHSIEILAKLPKLKKLKLYRLDNPKCLLDNLNLGQLNYLSIIGEGLPSTNKEMICQEVQKHYFPNLQRLFLSFMNDDHAKLTEDFFSNLIANAPKLKSIQLHDSECPVSHQFMCNFIKNSNIFVSFSSKSFEDFLREKCIDVFGKYKRMEMTFNDWASNNVEYCDLLWS